MSGNLKRKKKKISVSQFEKKFNDAIDFRINQLRSAVKVLNLELGWDYKERLDELETLKAYLKNSV